MAKRPFNEGKPYHGSEAVEDGKLTGATDGTDYFYFFCPKCPDKQLLRPLEYTLRAQNDDHLQEARRPQHGSNRLRLGRTRPER